MLTIKRYPNRKLYNTGTKRYICLSEIASLIKAGIEIRVIDHKNGDDLTALTLTQIVLEKQRNHAGCLSNDFLTNLIRSSDEIPRIPVRGIWESSSKRNLVDDEIRTRIQSLIHAGELTEGEGSRLLNQLLSRDPYQIGDQWLDEQIEALIHRRRIPLRCDVQRLHDVLNEIDLKVLEKTSGRGLD